MADDGELADRVRALLAGETVTERRMFGGLAFLLDGAMAVAASGRGSLMVRVDPAQLAALVGEPGVEPVRMGSRGPMRGWLSVHGETLTDDRVLDLWVRRGLACVRALAAGRG